MYRTRTLYRAAALISLAVLLGRSEVAMAISLTPFSPTGAGGTQNGQTLSIGPGGAAFEIDAFLHVGGASAQLSSEAAPGGLDYGFSASLSPDASDLTLAYAFTNHGPALMGLTFVSYVDLEIDEPINTFFNEFATTAGTLAAGQGFEVDEPGFAFGDIFQNAAAGTLDDGNALPFDDPDDVSMALSFAIATLGTGETFSIDLMLSEDGDSLGSFSILQADTDPGSTTTIRYSGIARVETAPPIPEPSARPLYLLGLAVVALGAMRSRRSG